MHELRDEPEWDLPALLGKMSPVDLVLVEGFKRDKFPKLEIYRAEERQAAAASGRPACRRGCQRQLAAGMASILVVIDLNDIEAIVDFLLKHAVPIAAARSA